MMKGRTLRLSRIIVSVIAFGLVTGLFTSIGMGFPRFAAWIARIQLLPAAMAFGMTVFTCWLIVTLIFGRAYCSTVCPLGFFQDIFARGRMLRRSRDYHFHQPVNRLRMILLIVTAVCLVAGIGIVPVFLDPYSAYGRIALNVVRPLWAIVNSVPVMAAGWSVAGFVTAMLTAVAVAWVAVRRGRLICNTVCPVGTTLGVISRYSIFHIDINTDLCIQCRKCEHACKGECIDLTSHVVDMSRCVLCFDCLPVCPNDAIRYTPSSHRLQLPMLQRIVPAGSAPEPAATSGPMPSEASGPRLIDRRHFLATGAIVALSPVIMRADKAARAIADAAGQHAPDPEWAVYPPGAADRFYFLSRCTGCGLCISHCSTGVLRTATTEYGRTLKGFLHPVMDFDRARCAFGCTRCNNLCPTGALMPLTVAEKQKTVIGHALTIHANCIGCGLCEKECPRRAITLNSGRRPIVNEALCIGCGACQSVCPAYPYKAIYVDGIADNLS